MNMFYTGLGIARSLGSRGIPVIGLTAQRGIYGNYTRYAETVFCPDSRKDPEALAAFLASLATKIGRRAVLFPTRDDDVVFLDRFRDQLEPHYSLVIPSSEAAAACLDKWQTYLCAREAGVPTPKCWLIESDEELHNAAREASYPCVLKPLAAHHWRRADNWEIVGGRKAIAIPSPEVLLAEYAVVRRAESRALVQEMIPGGDESLVATACYIDRSFRWAGSFTTQKLAQEPPMFGTGCIVQATDLSELSEPTRHLLEEMRFSGLAEVEYKWDQNEKAYKLIEINARPWDQHGLGRACGIDLIRLAYSDHAGLPMPVLNGNHATHKWVAEDVFIMAAARSLRRRDGGFRRLVRLARGNKTYGIWSAGDPLPFLCYFGFRLLPRLAGAGLKQLWSRFGKRRNAEADPGQNTSWKHL